MSFQKMLKISAVSTLIWLLVLAFFSSLSNQIALRSGVDSSFIGQVSNIVPWYASWIWLTPVVIYCVDTFLHNRQKLFSLILKHLLFLLVFWVVYMLSTGASVFLSFGSLVQKTNYWDGMQALIQNSQWWYDLSIYSAVMMSAYVVYYIGQIKIKDKKNEVLKSELYSAQLNVLRSQLNPHFLFNALNTISGLIRMKEVDNAVHALSELSYMLRAVLQENHQQFCLLSDEVSFIRKYLHFQKLRFADRLRVDLDIETKAESVKIPFLLIHTLLENAVKYGAEDNSKNYNISLNCKVLDNRLVVELANSINKNQHESGLGIGLMNSHKRLQHLYGDDYKLESRVLEDGRYMTLIQLPLEVENA